MSDFSATNPAGAFSYATRPAPPEHKPLQAEPEPSARSDTLAAQSRDRPAQEQAQAEKERHDPNTIAGPTPSFQASLLEIEADLQNAIKRIEAARSHAKTEAAIQPSPRDPEVIDPSQIDPSQIDPSSQTVDAAIPYNQDAHRA